MQRGPDPAEYFIRRTDGVDASQQPSDTVQIQQRSSLLLVNFHSAVDRVRCIVRATLDLRATCQSAYQLRSRNMESNHIGNRQTMAVQSFIEQRGLIQRSRHTIEQTP